MNSIHEQPNYALRWSVIAATGISIGAIGSKFIFNDTGEDQPGTNEAPVSRTCVPGPDTFIIKAGDIGTMWKVASDIYPEDPWQALGVIYELNPTLVNGSTDPRSAYQPGTYSIPICNPANQ